MASDQKHTVEKVLTLGPSPLILDTCHGPIEIHRIEPNDRSNGDRSRRRLRFVLPEGVTVCQSKAKLAERSQWMDVDEAGSTPRFRHLETVVQDGEFKGVRPAKIVKLKAGAPR